VVTTLGCSPSPHWSLARAPAAELGRPWLSLAWSPLASTAWSHCCYLCGRVALLDVPPRYRTADPPHAMTQSLPAPLPHRNIRASLCTSTPLLALFEATTAVRTWPCSPLPCHLWCCAVRAMADQGRTRLSFASARMPSRSRQARPAKARPCCATYRPSLFFSLSVATVGVAPHAIDQRVVISFQFRAPVSPPTSLLAARPHPALNGARSSYNLPFFPPPCR